MQPPPIPNFHAREHELCCHILDAIAVCSTDTLYHVNILVTCLASAICSAIPIDKRREAAMIANDILLNCVLAAPSHKDLKNEFT